MSLLKYKKLIKLMNYVLNKSFFHFTLGYTGYFVLGYYLSQTDIKKKYRYILYILSAMGFLFTIGASSYLSLHYHTSVDIFYDFLSINSLSFHSVVSVIGLSCIVFCISFIISSILNHIPFLNKYIV